MKKKFELSYYKLFLCIVCLITTALFNLKYSYSIGLKNKNFQDLSLINKVFSTDSDDSNFQYDMLSSVEDFINLPEGGTSWDVFANTIMDEYTFEDNEGFEWTGVRPKFSEEIKVLENKKILVQGYMFPLDQNDKQKTFLLIPFPVHCPYYPHATSNMIIEVHAKKSIDYSYEPINIEGLLELVPKDDLYNIFFRLKNAKLVSN